MTGVESKFKTKLAKQIVAEGGYARRFEDMFTVGVPDMIVVHPSCAPTFIEVKMVENMSTAYGMTARQHIEARRIRAAGMHAALLGVLLDRSAMALSSPGTAVRMSRALMRRGGETFIQFLKRWQENENENS